MTSLSGIIITFQYIHPVTQDTLVQTVGENVPILITVRNVKVNVTVMRTYVTYLPDVSLLQQVTTDDVKLFICFSYNIYKQQFTTLKLKFSQFKQDASLGTLVKTVEENVRIPITAWIVKISATVMRTCVISQLDVQILQKVLHHLVH